MNSTAVQTRSLPYRRSSWLALWLVLLALPLSALLGGLGLTEARPLIAQPLVREFVLGYSGQGRPIEVVQFGGGPRKLVVVGNTHGGPEANTYRLTNELIAYFRANPDAVPAAVRLYFIPTLNPDGLALDSRFDAAGVDLNRNMNTNLDSCPENDWSKTVFGAYGIVSDTGGAYPESQIESRLIRNFLLDAAGAIFLHSNAGLVFPAACEHPPSIAMGQVYAGAAGYAYSRFWPNYNITGGMHDWAGSLGIAAITPELISGTASEFAQNLAGLQAVLVEPETLLPLPEDGIVDGIVVPAPVYRYWRALGGAAVFGPPLTPAQQTADGLAQTFANARLELRVEQADTPYLVQPALLGLQRLPELAVSPAPPEPAPNLTRYVGPAMPSMEGPLYFGETGQTVAGPLLDYWQRNGGVAVFGLPLSSEFDGLTVLGEERRLQVFERAVLTLSADGSVQPDGLGWQALLRERAQLPLTPHTMR